MKLHIHGNCQSYVLSLMLREIHPEWDVSYFEVHADPIIAQNDDYRAAIRSADILLTQPIHEGYRGRSDLSSDWVSAEAKQGCEIVLIPALHFTGHHPGFSGLGLGDLSTNVLGAHLIADGSSPGAAVDLLLSPDLLDQDFVRHEIEMSLAEMARRETEDKIHIAVGPIAQHLAGNTQFFHIVNHPTRPLYAYLLTAVLKHLSLHGPDVSPAGTDYQSSPHVPMLPSVAYHCPESRDLPEGWHSDPDFSVRIPHYQTMSQRRYYELMVEQLSQYSPLAIRSALQANPSATGFLRRLSKARSSLPGMELWADSK